MKVRLAALVAVAAAVATTLVLATVGGAQTAPGVRTITLDAKTTKGGFFPHHRPRAGDRFGFTDRISGDDTGRDVGLCTFVQPKRQEAPCTVILKLSRGTMVGTGLVPTGKATFPIAISGGTGDYAGARGSAVIRNATQTRTHIVITLQP